MALATCFRSTSRTVLSVSPVVVVATASITLTCFATDSRPRREWSFYYGAMLVPCLRANLPSLTGTKSFDGVHLLDGHIYLSVEKHLLSVGASEHDAPLRNLEITLKEC